MAAEWKCHTDFRLTASDVEFDNEMTIKHAESQEDADFVNVCYTCDSCPVVRTDRLGWLLDGNEQKRIATVADLQFTIPSSHNTDAF